MYGKDERGIPPLETSASREGTRPQLNEVLHTMTVTEVDVLIVGGGPVGLLIGLFLPFNFKTR